MSEEPLQILYRDEQYVAVNKPAGLLVHRSDMDPGETRFCLQMLRDQIGQAVYPVHRLDRPTSGVLLFALDKDSLRAASGLFAAKEASKIYFALVRGWLEGTGVIDHPLAHPDDFDAVRGGGQPQDAVTHYRSLSLHEVGIPVEPHPTSRYTLVELRPQTGRTHQLRRHLKHLSHPIIGDTRYGDGRHNRLFREHFNCPRLLLHAARLEFMHPRNGTRIEIAAPLDDDFARVLRDLPAAGAAH